MKRFERVVWPMADGVTRAAIVIRQHVWSTQVAVFLDGQVQIVAVTDGAVRPLTAIEELGGVGERYERAWRWLMESRRVCDLR